MWKSLLVLLCAAVPALAQTSTPTPTDTPTPYCFTAVPTSSPTATRTPSLTLTPTPNVTNTPTVGGMSHLVGFIPSIQTAKDVIVIGSTAYVASAEFGLSIVNVASPSNPIVVGAANPPFYADHCAVSGSLAACAGNLLGMKIVNIANPAAPITVGTVTGTISNVARGGNFAYALKVIPGNPAHVDLVIYDVTNPANPVQVGARTLAGGGSIKLVGTLAYVTCGAPGFQIVDVSTPSNPVILSTTDTPGTANAIDVSGGTAWVADGTSIRAYNVSNPAAPSLIVGSVVAQQTALAVSISGTQLSVIDFITYRLFSIANPAAPSQLGTMGALQSHSIAQAGANVYFAASGVDGGTNEAGFYSVSVANPSTPTILANIYTLVDANGVGEAGTIAVAAAGNSQGLRVVDVTNSAAPVQVGSIPSLTFAGATMATSTVAYALQVVPGNPAHTDLVVINLSPPSAPTIVGRRTLLGGGDLAVAGTFVYVAVGTSGMQVVDVSTPSSPQIVRTLDTPGTGAGIALAATTAYIGDGTSVQIANIAVPASASLIGSVPLAHAGALTTLANRLYVLDPPNLQAFDITTPGSPVALSTSSDHGAQDIIAKGTRLYLSTPAISHSDPTGGIYVVDVSNPSSPQLLNQIIVPGTTRRITAGTSFVYAGDSGGILDVVSP